MGASSRLPWWVVMVPGWRGRRRPSSLSAGWGLLRRWRTRSTSLSARGDPPMQQGPTEWSPWGPSDTASAMLCHSFRPRRQHAGLAKRSGDG